MICLPRRTPAEAGSLMASTSDFGSELAEVSLRKLEQRLTRNWFPWHPRAFAGQDSSRAHSTSWPPVHVDRLPSAPFWRRPVRLRSGQALLIDSQNSLSSLAALASL